MRIMWSNVVCFGLFIFGMVLLFKNTGSIAAAFGTIGYIGNTRGDPHAQVVGLIVLTVLLISMLGVIKFLTQRDRDGK